MTKKRPLVFALLFCSLFLGFKAGDDIEIMADFLNARSSTNFLKTYKKNIVAKLNKGTTGTVTEVKNFTDKSGKPTGNSGVKILVTSGPKKGQSYWVYNNKDNRSLKLVDKASKKEILPEAVRPEGKTDATVIRDTEAIREPAETVVRDAAELVETVISEGVTPPQIQEDCPPQIPDPPKPNIPSSMQQTYSPEAALADLNSGELKFVGRDLLPGSGQNRTCVYKNDKVYVFYGNCMSNKKESVMDMRIVANNGESIHFYMEDFKGRAPSTMKREEYSGTWRVSYNKVERPAQMNMSQVKDYVEAIESSITGCWVSSDKADCYGELKAQLSDWGPAAENFWQKPSNEWYSTQQKMRKVIQATRF